MATALARTDHHTNEGPAGSATSSWTVTTVVYGDLDDSTTLLRDLGDEQWLDVLHTYRFIVAQRVDAHSGDRVRTWGDGFMATFADSTAAQRSAVEIQQALARFSRQHPEAPLRARLGVHTGRVIEVGDDCYGVTVHLAARLTDAAAGGRILVSADAREAGRLHEGNYNPEQRRLALKGWCEPQVAYELSWRDGTAGATAQEARATPVFQRVVLL